MAQFEESTPGGGWRVLSVEGEFDLAVVDEFVERARGCLAQAEAIEIDLGGVSFIDSSGLGALVRIHKEAAEQGKAASLTNLTPPTRRLLEITGLTDAFDIRPKES